MRLTRPPIINLKMTVRADCAVSANSSLSLSIKTRIPCFSGMVQERAGSWPLDRCPPSPTPSQLPASEIKQTSLSTNLPVYWLLRVKQPDPIHLSVTIGGIWLNFQVVQWLRLCAPNARDLGSIPGQGTESHML